MRLDPVKHTPSTSLYDAAKAVAQIVWHFKMGAICPAEVWTQLAEVLSRGEVNQILNTLPPELQAELRELHRERRLSFSTICNNQLQQQIENWCLAPPASTSEYSVMWPDTG